MEGVKDLQLVQQPQTPLEMIERMASSREVDVDKFERFLQMRDREVARAAESAFNAAMSDAQTAMRPIEADGYNPSTKSKFATYAAMDRALRPIYTENGFGLSFDTGDGAPADFVRVLCYVTHRAGHSRTYKIDMPADGKGAKGGDVMTKTHAAGSAMSYGMRYLLKMIFNVAVGEDDDDGNRAGDDRSKAAKAPDGFDTWLVGMEKLVADGADTTSLMAAWDCSDLGFKKHLTEQDLPKIKTWQATAAKVKKATK